MDGAKGIHKAIRDGFGRYAVIQRCTWHKQENVLKKVENEQERKAVRRALREAYGQDTHAEANRALLDICTDLESKGCHRAANSLREGMEETLPLQQAWGGKRTAQEAAYNEPHGAHEQPDQVGCKADQAMEQLQSDASVDGHVCAGH